uniref:Transcription elongation factor 1 homolog n=1 Tax=Aegilops tauschii TaxID=37682 RepID=M8C6P4_AEGTA
MAEDGEAQVDELQDGVEDCCPFCNHPDSVACTIDLKLYVITAVCYVCQEVYHTTAHYLTEPVDVYHDWIDACEMANQGVELQALDYHKQQRRVGSDDDIR